MVLLWAVPLAIIALVFFWLLVRRITRDTPD